MNIHIQDTTENIENFTVVTFTSDAKQADFSEHLQNTLGVHKFEGKTGQVVVSPSFGFANSSSVNV